MLLQLANDEIRILLVGSPGAGKSATGNAIAGTVVFTEYAIVDPQNTHTKAHSANRFGKKIRVVDTPGCLFTDDPSKIPVDQLNEFNEKAAPGPHAIVLVVSAANRFTPKEMQTLSNLMQVLHKEFEKFGIVVFTLTETWERQKYTVETFFETIPKSAQDLLSSCMAKKRALAFQNSSDDKSHVKQLLDMVEEMKNKNVNQFFRVDDLRLGGDINSSRQNQGIPAVGSRHAQVLQGKLDEREIEKDLHPILIEIFEETLTEVSVETDQESKKHRYRRCEVL